MITNFEYLSVRITQGIIIQYEHTVTAKVSAQCVPAPAAGICSSVFAGPASWNVVKSSLSWQISIEYR